MKGRSKERGKEESGKKERRGETCCKVLGGA